MKVLLLPCQSHVDDVGLKGKDSTKTFVGSSERSSLFRDVYMISLHSEKFTFSGSGSYSSWPVIEEKFIRDDIKSQ